MSMSISRVRPVPTADYLFKAVEEKNVNRLTQLFSSRKADPNCFNAAGEPLIVVAVRTRFFQGLKVILNQPGIDLNLKDRNGETVMHAAARKGDFVVLQMIVENGGHKNVRDKEGFSPLHHAVKAGSYAIVDYLVNDPDRRHKHLCEVNINAVAKDQSTPLLNACYGSDLHLVKLLVEAGARTDWRDATGYTAKALAVLKGWDREIEVEIPMDPYTDEFIKRKAVAHCYGIGDRSKIGKTTFSLTGAYSPYMHRMMHWQLKKFFSYKDDILSFAEQQAILEAFEHTLLKFSPAGIVDRFQKGLLTIVQAGWVKHSIDLVFFKDYMAICNRGEGVPEGLNTIEVFKINPKQVTLAVINKILEQEDSECIQASSYFYFDLPVALSPYPEMSVQDPLCKIAARFAPKLVKEGTCTFASAKAALRASLMLPKMVTVKSGSRLQNSSTQQNRPFEALCSPVSSLESSSMVSSTGHGQPLPSLQSTSKSSIFLGTGALQSAPDSYRSIGRKSRKISKQIATFGRILMLEQYLQFHFLSQEDRLQAKSQLDLFLVKKCYWKARKHVNATEGDLSILFRSRLSELQKNYPEVMPIKNWEFERFTE